jgi:hypothetical protein
MQISTPDVPRARALSPCTLKVPRTSNSRPGSFVWLLSDSGYRDLHDQGFDQLRRDHGAGGGLADDPGAVAGSGSWPLRNGITREATRPGSSSITQSPWPSSSSTWADGNAWRWRSACSLGRYASLVPQMTSAGRSSCCRAAAGLASVASGCRAVQLQYGALGCPGPGSVVDVIDLVADQPRVLPPEQQPERRTAGRRLEDLAHDRRPVPVTP